MLLDELDRVLAAFREAGIEAIVLKGAALIRTVYSHPAQRPMSDVDLLVCRKVLLKASKLVQAMGYKVVRPHIQREWLLWQTGHHLHLSSAQGGHVDIHWKLSTRRYGRPEVPASWPWENAFLLDVGFRTLRHEAHLLHLCNHLVLEHGFAQARLIWLYDLFRLFVRRLDWNWMKWQAESIGWQSALRLSLQTIQQCFPFTIPSSVRNLEPGPDEILAGRKMYILSRTENAWLIFRALPIRYKIRFILAYLFPHSLFLWHKYPWLPRGLLPLAYLVRLGDVFTATLQALWRHVRQRLHLLRCTSLLAIF
ncbi:hypothetical protein D6833_12800 [Candidatus Parcubacteria bacterium]|nr:MAG: hypothetical protein D6833_12800 [Candidatus Parcubacteria bacterium]